MSGLEPLAGYTVGITSTRRRAELSVSFQRAGARVFAAPAVRIVEPAGDSRVLAATRRLLAAPPDLVVITTARGLQGWLRAAAGRGLAGRLTQMLAALPLVARAPAARDAVTAAGLTVAWSPDTDSVADTVQHLQTQYELRGKRVAVQLHGEPLPDIVEALQKGGAEVIEIPVYRWTLPTDSAPLRRLVETVADLGLDAVTFTSASAAASFLQMAQTLDRGPRVRDVLRGEVLAACIGPVTAAPLQREWVPVSQPPQPRLDALVAEVISEVPRLRGRIVEATGHRLDVRGHLVVVDDRLIPLGSATMALLRELARDPGHVVSRARLLEVLPGDGVDGHAVDVAIARLRSALGDARIVHTVIKRGYRLNLTP
jgi:uroporphyrinogen-III synthase